MTSPSLDATGSTDGRRWRSDAFELLSSMRFAIALLTVICIASVIGTVLKQREPLTSYVNQFGPFWSEVFGQFSLYAVYSAWWFLVILAFLVVSTSLCIARNTPKILADLRTFKENIREQSLKAFGHHVQAELAGEAKMQAMRMGQTLVQAGWKVKLQPRPNAQGEGWMVAAKAGAGNKLGYLAAHSAIVLVCVGGLLDGDVVVRMQTWFNGKEVYSGGGMIADVPPQHRLATSNPTFRGNLLVPEGGKASTVILSQPTGVLLQDLPFSIELKKFVVEYYQTGMPKLFASDIVVHDHATGEAVPGRVEVNHPMRYKGVEIFQSSFDDGGSSLKLRAVPMSAPTKPFLLDGVVGGSSSLTNGSEKVTLEITGLRVINVENFAGEASGADVRAVDLRHSIESRLGADNKTPTEKKLKNIGPSFTYKLRDASGQATEFSNYMQPVDIDGNRVFLLGMRESASVPFRYLRIPADEKDSLDGWLRLRDALRNPVLRRKAVVRYAAGAVEAGRPELTQALVASADRAVGLFAGDEPMLKQLGSGADAPKGGLQAVSAFMERNVPEAEREKASEVLIRILNGTLLELNQLAREQAGLPSLPKDDAARAFLSQSVVSLSDAFFYIAPMAFMMEEFNQVQASVFQVSRAPGKTVVYLGCFLLVVGVFAMLYIRERRLWVWVMPIATEDGRHGAHVSMALSSNRKTMEADQEFAQLQRQLFALNS